MIQRTKTITPINHLCALLALGSTGLGGNRKSVLHGLLDPNFSEPVSAGDAKTVRLGQSTQVRRLAPSSWLPVFLKNPRGFLLWLRGSVFDKLDAHKAAIGPHHLTLTVDLGAFVRH